MNVKERYNSIISDIEKEIQDPNTRAADIVLRIAQSIGVTGRELNSVTKFFLDCPAMFGSENQMNP